MKFEYINNHYGVNAELGRDILFGDRKATIAKDLGNYIGVIFHDDAKAQVMPCHPTSEITYLDSFTELKKLKPKCKNPRSKQRYQDYLSASEWYGGSFFDYIRDEKMIKNMTYFD